MNSAIFDIIKDDNTILEREPLEQMALADELRAYKHYEFWQCMDTKRDRDVLEKEALNGSDPWQK